MSIDLLEEAVNTLSDNDRSWWPFLWLRPEKHAPFSLGRLTALAILYGAPTGALFSVAWAFIDPRARAAALIPALGFPVFFLFVTSAVIGPMWNRRAERLRARIE
jgi:hypothetical protein